MTDQQETPTPATDTMDAADRAAYEDYQAKLQANRARREEAERLRLQAAALEAGRETPADDEARLAATLVDSWDIRSEELPAVLTGYNPDGHPIARLVLRQERLEQLLQDLNRLYIAPEDTALTWAVRYPDYGDTPVLTLFRGAEALGSLPLDEDFGKPVGRILANLYPTEPRVPRWQRFKAWVRKHPVYSVLIALVALPFVAVFLFGTIVNLIAYF